MKVLRASKMERCIGCQSCSLACARLVHGKLSWNTAGVRIASSGGITAGFEAKLCMACDPAPCVKACPTGAFKQRPGGGVIFKRELCIECGRCAEACPIDAIFLDSHNHPYVCIHCGQCVAFCPHGCLEMRPVVSNSSVTNVIGDEHASSGITVGTRRDADVMDKGVDHVE